MSDAGAAPQGQDDVDAGFRQRRQRRHVMMMALTVVGMFGFGFAMVPFYQLICSVTGLNSTSASSGRTAIADVSSFMIDRSRNVTVEFDATVTGGLQWEFRPLVKQIKVHPGEMQEVSFYARNLSDRTVVAQAVPGITPWQATKHFNKTVCFCFVQQTLEPGEARVMPLRFVLDPALPGEFHTVTLSYSLMDTARNPSPPQELDSIVLNNS